MNPTFVTKPEIKLAGFALETSMNEFSGENMPEIPAFWERYAEENWQHDLHEVLTPVSHNEYGACIMLPDKPDRFLYMIGVEVSDFEQVPEAMFTTIVPASTYAVFTSPKADRADGAFTAAIQSMTASVYNEWLPNSGYIYAKGGVDFELYDERSHGDQDLQMDLYVPVKKKA